jgi:excisionase family DNA binding protein
MSTTEVCQALSCSRNTVLIMIQRGDLQAIKRGRDWQIYGDLPDPESIRPGRKCGPQKRIPIQRMQPVVTISLTSIPKRNPNK